jgi:hypothetical protein
MTIANTFAAKLSVAFVAIAMALSMVAPAQAATAAEMQAQIDALMAQLAALTNTSSSSSSMMSCKFDTDMTIGAKNATDVQNFLIKKGHAIAAGATGYFGGQTASAVAAFQTANGITPAAGYWGPKTRAVANTMCSATTGGDEDDEDEDEDDSSSAELSGEASLDSVKIENGDDTDIEEGQEAAPVADIDVEFTDGDAIISRIDIALLGSGSTTDPWDTFEEVTLWVDGDEVASIDASDEDNYLDEDEGSLRFSGLDIVAMEDEEVTITVGVTVQTSIDGTDDGEDWDVAVGAIRYVDADDVTTTEDNVGEQEVLDGTYTHTAEFTIEEEGGEDEIIVKTASEDLDAETFILEDDSKSDYMTVFAFDLDTDDSTNDIEINSVPVSITVANDNFGDIVSDLALVIDGEEFDDWSYTSGSAATTGTVVVEFDIDGDLTIEAGERIGAELQVEFKALVTEGATIQGSVTGTNADNIDAEGADDLSAAQLSGSATGETHTLRTAGLIVDLDSVKGTTDTQGTNDTTGIFTIEFDVTAEEGDFYVKQFASTTAIAGVTTGGVGYAVEGPGTPTYSGVLSSTGAEDTPGVFTVNEGETETFTLTVSVDASVTGQHRLTITELIFSENTNGVTGSEVQALTPVSDYRTAYENINAS